MLDEYAAGTVTALNTDGLQPFTYAAVEAAQALDEVEASEAVVGKKGAAVSQLVAQKRARLQTILAERGAWASQLMQIKRMHSWVLEVEHILDGSWAQKGEEVSNAMVGSRLDTWREQMAKLLTDGMLCELERECLSEFLQELSNLRPYLVQCYDRKDFPRTVPRDGTQHSGTQNAVSSHQWSQELERVSAALWALRGVCGLVGARCGPSPTAGAARWQARPRSLAPAATGDHRRPP